MSPHVGNFVQDLVEMAKATERLPQLEQELADNKKMLDSALVHNQGLEQNIIFYKDTIEALHSRIRSLEVERDDASFRVLEAEDREHNVLAMARSIASAVENVISTLDPPKPEPVKEAEATPIPEAVHSISEVQPQGQSVADPTTTISTDGNGNTTTKIAQTGEGSDTLGQSESPPTASTGQMETAASWTPAPDTDVGSTTKETSSADPALGPYFGKRYRDVEGYVSYHDWIEGGGSYQDYYNRSSF